jgi:hypothetical protein
VSAGGSTSGAVNTIGAGVVVVGAAVVVVVVGAGVVVVVGAGVVVVGAAVVVVVVGAGVVVVVGAGVVVEVVVVGAAVVVDVVVVGGSEYSPVGGRNGAVHAAVPLTILNSSIDPLNPALDPPWLNIFNVAAPEIFPTVNVVKSKEVNMAPSRYTVILVPFLMAAT